MKLDEILNKDNTFKYQLLGRLQSDCEYYLGYGNRSTNRLWAGSEKEQIATMKNIWKSFSKKDKPKWLLWRDILKYEKQMCI